VTLRIKITDEMVEAAIAAIRQDMRDEGIEMATEDEEPEGWDRMRRGMRKALEAAATEVGRRRP